MNSQRKTGIAINNMLAFECSYRQIKELLQVGNSRIASLANGEEMDHRSGRPPVCDRRVIDFIEAQTLIDARLSDGEIAALLERNRGVKVH